MPSRFPNALAFDPRLFDICTGLQHWAEQAAHLLARRNPFWLLTLEYPPRRPFLKLRTLTPADQGSIVRQAVEKT